MEIWLLLTVLGMVSSTSTLISLVENGTEPKDIQEGSSVSLLCHLFTNSSGRCIVTWFFNSSTTFKIQNLSTQRFSDCNEQKVHTVHNVSQNQSGLYFCNSTKDIPILENELSGKTQLNVVPKKRPFMWSDWWMWITLGAAGLVLLILVLVCFVLRRRQLKQRDLDCRIYANMHPVNCRKQPSPRVGPPDTPNTLKMDSSYQNLRTPDVGMRYEQSRRVSPRQ
ncbi:uncharacterized protein LOC110174092 isoform X2 [Boleophthalmus pectinirostris]|uniref:uncharacterized protein LOC110174092 isoform X2 n=1 Tax=Boleophthalmus pectinirostris TaxID=150288 RepID=UPI000A1C47FB|nr:uncharacterized protein LOC110174092 isoform X2 [Boleophthalmus pectinirostris]